MLQIIKLSFLFYSDAEESFKEYKTNNAIKVKIFRLQVKTKVHI